ncbi:heme o synthase [Salipaludibacillus neizhouensis]|nr:heme o synthase [Salipaludibacillus neizhouensis]
MKNKDKTTFLQKEGKMPSINEGKTSLLNDLKELFKLKVLLANILPVFTGFWLALYFSDASFSDHWLLFFQVLIGSTFIVAGALIINNWYDVDIDSVMNRTMNRPTVTGHISLRTVLTMGILFTLVGFILLIFTTLEATLYAAIGWFTYVFLYTIWTKRRYTWNTLIGSVSGAVTPLIGWAVLEPASHVVPIVLCLILFIFQMPHTFAIAMRKRDEYRDAKVAMLPVVRGFQVTKWHILFYVACLIPFPFYLTSLGTFFVGFATLLNLGWLGLSIYGFFTKNDFSWARVQFIYSVGYVTVLFVMMVVVTFPVFH